MTSSEVIKLSANSFAILVIVLLGLILIPVPEDLPTKIVAAVLLALGLALNCFQCMRLARLAYTRMIAGCRIAYSPRCIFSRPLEPALSSF